MWSVDPITNIGLQSRNPGRIVVDKSEYREILESVMQEELGNDIPYDALYISPRLPKKPIINQATGLLVEQGDYHFAYRSNQLNIGAQLRGRLTAEALYNVIKASVSAIRMAMREVLSGDWVLCAYEVAPSIKHRRARVPNPQYGLVLDSWKQGKPNQERYLKGMVEEECINHVLVFYETSRIGPEDAWFNRTGKTDAPMQQWERAGRLPRPEQERREKALDVVRRYCEYNHLVGEVPFVAPEPPKAKRIRRAKVVGGEEPEAA